MNERILDRGTFMPTCEAPCLVRPKRGPPKSGPPLSDRALGQKTKAGCYVYFLPPPYTGKHRLSAQVIDEGLGHGRRAGMHFQFPVEPSLVIVNGVEAQRKALRNLFLD